MHWMHFQYKMMMINDEKQIQNLREKKYTEIHKHTHMSLAKSSVHKLMIKKHK